MAQAFGAKIIDQENCGINYFNFNDTMIDCSTEISVSFETDQGSTTKTHVRQGLHPSLEGQRMMGEAAVKAILFN